MSRGRAKLAWLVMELFFLWMVILGCNQDQVMPFALLLIISMGFVEGGGGYSMWRGSMSRANMERPSLTVVLQLVRSLLSEYLYDLEVQ